MENAAKAVGRVTRSQDTSMSIAVIVASGGRFGEPNASNALAEIFVVLFPRNNFELKHRHTSGIMKCPAISREFNRFSNASFLRSKKGVWEPVSMTGLPRF